LSSRRRNEEEIIIQILQACSNADGDINNGIDKLRIMSAAFLSDKEAVSYLSMLVANGLLEYHESLKRYSITAKGKEFLRKSNPSNDNNNDSRRK
jgi:predicted transcriptional regulator